MLSVPPQVRRLPRPLLQKAPASPLLPHPHPDLRLGCDILSSIPSMVLHAVCAPTGEEAAQATAAKVADISIVSAHSDSATAS
jgi:hypothetical protein